MTTGYRIGRAIDRSNAEKAEKRRRALEREQQQQGGG
jgi:hypothetical protein